MILSAQSIRRLGAKMIHPFSERAHIGGMTYGLGPAGYDIRLNEGLVIPSKGFALASAYEYIICPDDLMIHVMDKSTHARQGITVQNTVIEPGWEGYLTLEIINHSAVAVDLPIRTPIAQLIFLKLDEPTDTPYRGKYQKQARGPQAARFEK